MNLGVARRSCYGRMARSQEVSQRYRDEESSPQTSGHVDKGCAGGYRSGQCSSNCVFIRSHPRASAFPRPTIQHAENRWSPARSPGSISPARDGSVTSSLRHEAVAAIDRLRTTRAEWDACLSTAARARRAEHLPRTAVVTGGLVTSAGVGAAAGFATRRLAQRAARGAATRLAELAIRVKALLARSERCRTNVPY